MNLYELTGNIREFMELCADPEAEPDQQIIKDTLEGLDGAYDDKVEGWCKVIKNLDAEAKALKEEAKRLQGRQKTIENNIDRMKAALMESLKATGKTEAGGLLKAKIQKNGGLLPVIVDDVEIPEEYQKITIEVNKEAIRDALEQGKELSFARYGERGESIRIK